MIDSILEEFIKKNAPDDNVAVLLSGGVDSLSLAFAADRLGKKVHAYNFHLEDDVSYDTRTANIVSSKFKWEITNVAVPVNNLIEDFYKLSKQYLCKKKTQYECTYPFLYVYPEIKQKYILSGIGADGWYGLSKKCMIHFKEPKELFDKYRIDSFKSENYAGLNQQLMLAKENNKILLNPYLNNEDVKEFFMRYNHKELHNGAQKSHVRRAYQDYFSRIPKVKPHWNLQLCSNVDKLFETLLDNQEINYKKRKRVMDICRDWAVK